MARQNITDFECNFWKHHPHLENHSCTAVLWSDLWAVIGIPCYFRPKSKSLNFDQNSNGCLWQPLDLTIQLLYNIDFPKGVVSAFRNIIQSLWYLLCLNKPLFGVLPTGYYWLRPQVIFFWKDPICNWESAQHFPSQSFLIWGNLFVTGKIQDTFLSKAFWHEWIYFVTWGNLFVTGKMQDIPV